MYPEYSIQLGQDMLGSGFAKKVLSQDAHEQDERTLFFSSWRICIKEVYTFKRQPYFIIVRRDETIGLL